MLQAMLLAALIAAPLGSAALFVPARLIDRGAGPWSAPSEPIPAANPCVGPDRAGG